MLLGSIFQSEVPSKSKEAALAHEGLHDEIPEQCSPL